ncbi:hypothetical protein [Ruegeria sp. ANG-S4]|nr:hypothetical protein [Ruegeria sp. ANG-S4]
MAVFVIILVRLCSYDSYEGAGYQGPDKEYWSGGDPIIVKTLSE